jgi:CubicO group peptidase (beta-lactamase class C family)
MLKRYLAAIALILSLIAFDLDTAAQTPPLADADAAAGKADEFLAQWDAKDLPGGAVGVVKDGRLVYRRAFGMANLEYDVPNAPSTLFNLASASKPFTAMCIALLAERGKLSLDDDIRKYVPEIPQYGETVTIRHLIHHTSGIREYQALIFFGGLGADNAYSDQSILNMLARQKNLSFAPGTKHQYSNSNYHLLGIIVGRVSGKSLRAFAEENIFKPLGMKNTMFFDNRFEVVKNRASGYRVAPDKSVRARASLFDLVGGGGVLTTVEDLALWDRNFYEPKVGNRELLTLLTTPGALKSGEKVNYGFGLFHNEYRGLPVIKHSGNMTGYRAQIVSFPARKLTVIALSNSSAIFPSVIVEKLADIYLEGQLKPAAPRPKRAAESLPPAVALTEKEALRYAGVYASAESGAAFKLSFKDGKLMNGGLLRNETPVTPVAENRFVMAADADRYELIAVLNGAGAVSQIKLTTNGGKTDIFVPVKAPFDTPRQLSEYAGVYHSDELDADYKLTLQGDDLALRIGENFENRLTAAYADYFTIRGGEVNLSFARDEKGKITGFVFNSSLDERDVKGIAFRRR